MALYVLQPGIQPLGQFDFLDTDLASVVGGDFGVWGETSRTITSTEKAAQDALDGYVADQVDAGDATATRPVLQLGDSGSTAAAAHYLLDDGTTDYGTLYGELIGNPVGLATTGSQLGPHTASGSGKVTAWDKPGLYAVSTDALDSDVVPTTGNVNDTPLPGELLYRGASTAQLTRTVSANLKAALFVELAGNGSLVTTPGRLVGAAEAFDRVLISYLGATHNM